MDINFYKFFKDQDDNKSETANLAGFEIKRFTLPGNYGRNVIVHTYPHGNCQVFSIALFNNILKNSQYTNENILEMCKAISTFAGTKLLLSVDVQKMYCDDIDSTFKGRVVFKSPYESTNGSEMCMYLLKLSNIPLQT